jgi:hypothetical protein
MNNSRLTPAVAALAMLAGVAIGASGTAQAVPTLATKALTKAKVAVIAQREANRAIDRRAATLRVARADTATTAQDADALGGKAPSAYLTAADLVTASAVDAGCDPWSAMFQVCNQVQVTLTRPSRLHLTSETPFGPDSPGAAYGDCRLTLDGVVLAQSVVDPGSDASGSLVGNDDNLGYGFTMISDPVAAGVHVVGQECNEQAGDIAFTDTSLSVLAIPVS